MKKRVFNFRIVFVFACLFALGILYAKDILSLKVSAIILCSLILLGFIVWSIIDKDWKKSVIPILAFLIGFGACVLSDAIYFNNNVCDGNHEIYGRVEYVYKQENEYQTFVLSKVKIDGESQSKNIYVSYTSNGVGLDVGDIISFNSTLNKIELWQYGQANTFYYKNKVASYCSTNWRRITIEDSKVSLSEKLQKNVKQTLYSNMTEQNAALSYAAIFGDKSNIDDEIQNAFSSIGIAHLLAISGLHIGFLVLLLCWILKKCGLNQKWHILVVAPILIIYCSLCRFSPSVIRATIMAIVLLLSRSLGKKNDLLTTLSIALLIILAVKPLYIFDGGLQLSFMCVFSIIILSPIFQKLFDKLKVNKLGEILSPILAIQIGVLPIMMKMFNNVSIMTILANFICLPVFEIAYILLMVLLPISMIIPIFGVALIAPEFLINSICVTALNLSEKSVSFGLLYTGKEMSVCWILLLLSLSRFVMTKALIKTAISFGLVFVFAMLCLISQFQYIPKNNTVSIMEDSGIFVIAQDNNYYLVNTSDDFESQEQNVAQFLRELKIYKIKSIITTYDIETSLFQTKKSNIISGESDDVECFYALKNFTAISFSIEDKSFLFVSSIRGKTEQDNINYHYKDKSFNVVVNMTNYKLDIKSNITIDKSKIKNDELWTIGFGYDTLKEARV